MPIITPYANGQRVIVTMDDGDKWWLAPDGFGKYVAVPGEGQPQKPIVGDSIESLMRDLLGADADAAIAELVTP